MTKAANKPRKDGAVHPLQALVIIVVFAALLLGWLTARDKMLNAAQPSHLLTTESGPVLVRFDGTLFPVSSEGKVGTGLPLPAASQRVQPALFQEDQLWIYSAGGDGGLKHCLLGHAEPRCVPFAPDVSLSGGGRLLWNSHHQQLLVAATRDHELRIHDSAGVLQSTVTGLRYPNGIWQQGDRLLVADTNNHRIAAISLPAPDAATTLTKINEGQGFRWPTAVAVVGQEYWVLVADGDLEPHRLYRYDAQWQSLGRAATALQDPTMLVPLGDGALVIDRAQRLLWRLDNKGNALDSVTLPGQAQAEHIRGRWQWLGYVLLALFVLALAGGLAFAFWHDRHRLPKMVSGDDLSGHRGSDEPFSREKQWLSHGPLQRMRYGYLLLPLMLMALVALVLTADAADAMEQSELWPLLLLMPPLLLLGPLAFWLLSYSKDCGIAVQGRLLMLHGPDGQVVVGTGKQVLYSPTLLAVDGVIVPLGSHVMGLFNRQQLRDWVAPRLEGAYKMTGYQALLLVWRRRFWPLLSMYLLVSLLILMTAIYMIIQGMS